MPYVSRGGIKLEAAIDFFNIRRHREDYHGCWFRYRRFYRLFVKKGAQKVYCIDVGYGQLAWPLRKDPRVVPMERLNVRYLDKIIREQGEQIQRQGV